MFRWRTEPFKIRAVVVPRGSRAGEAIYGMGPWRRYLPALADGVAVYIYPWMTAGELHDLLVSRLTRKIGGTRRRWRHAIGEVRVYDPTTHPHCNWSVQPSGNAGENAAIETLLDAVRLEIAIVQA